MSESPAFQLARNIKRLRSRLGLSQEQLSELSGLTPSQISRLERAVANPTLRTLEQVAIALRIDVGLLLLSADESRYAAADLEGIVEGLRRLPAREREVIADFVGMLISR